ncbi:MAG: 50S ribosomal protein L13 [Sedimentisphaerales bacterium]|nr:50S ribosomal protein L13 [Sedimentisphaerales bacterium]
MKSFMARKEDVSPAWHVIDADGQILGRLATRIAMVLMGKDKPTYTPHVDTGGSVIVVNAEKIRITGKKANTKSYQRYSGYPGGQKQISYQEMLSSKPEQVVRLAVKRMLPKNTLGNRMLKKLRVYTGPEHTHSAQQPVKMEL